jgi:predicted nucleic acid-binding protein
MGVTVLDAGVLIAIMNGEDVHHREARIAVESILGIDELVIPVSAYAEVLVLPSRLGEQAVARTDELIDSLPARVEPASRAVARAAARLRARYGPRLRLADALVVATAEVESADRILTTDRGWPRFGLRVDIVGAS